MQIFIGSDIHGSSANAKRFFDIVDSNKKENDDTIAVLLGDIYNHGPRNPFPEKYAPMEVATLLNERKDYIMVAKGNCDSEVDQMISEFEIVNDINMMFAGHNILFTHGHKCSVYAPKMYAKSGDIVFYGHFHKPNIEVKDGVIYVCVGALGLSPDGVCRSYAVLDENGIKIISLQDGEVLLQHHFDK